MNGTIIEFREVLWQTKDERLSFRRVRPRRQEVERHPVEYVSYIGIYSVFKATDVVYEVNPRQLLR